MSGTRSRLSAIRAGRAWNHRRRARRHSLYVSARPVQIRRLVPRTGSGNGVGAPARVSPVAGREARLMHSVPYSLRPRRASCSERGTARGSIANLSLERRKPWANSEAFAFQGDPGSRGHLSAVLQLAAALHVPVPRLLPALGIARARDVGTRKHDVSLQAG